MTFCGRGGGYSCTCPTPLAKLNMNTTVPILVAKLLANGMDHLLPSASDNLSNW